jgi:hypothetical protein
VRETEDERVPVYCATGEPLVVARSSWTHANRNSQVAASALRETQLPIIRSENGQGRVGLAR